ncbi:uncharacterized protein LOC124491261 [Dermatophagoides farinae]
MNRISIALKMLESWSIQNQLSFNPNKTVAMIVTRRRKFDMPTIYFKNSPISIVKNIRYLGVILDSKLLWNDHISYIKSKALSIYNMLRRKFASSWGLSFDVLRLIYLHAIEPLITYASPVWFYSLSKTNVKSRLLSIQRIFALSIIRGYRTISLEASLVLANIVPIDLRIIYLANMYRIKHCLPVDHLSNLKFQLTLPVEDFHHPSVSFNFLNNVCNFNHNYHIYTDGSKLAGHVGCAVVIFPANSNQSIDILKFRLADSCSIFQAELFAIYQASEWLKRNNQSAKIFIDSYSALLACCSSKSNDLLVHGIQLNLVGIHFCLQWIPSHSGYLGNELADQHAKDATNLSYISYDFCPVSLAKYFLKNIMFYYWDNRWKTSRDGSVTRRFFPSIYDRLSYYIDLNFTLVQFLSGHGKFRHYLYNIGYSTDSSCWCGIDTQNSIHLICYCQRFASPRFQIENRCGLSLHEETLPIWITKFPVQLFEFLLLIYKCL